MIRITVLTVGKLKEKYLREGCDEYLKRLSAFSKVQVVELPESRCPADPSPAEIQRVLEQEGDSILAKIPKGARVIPLCIEGRELSSAQLAARVADFSQQSSHLVFVIGGSYGLSPRVKAAGDLQLSFGKMTLPHQLARLVLLEQFPELCEQVMLFDNRAVLYALPRFFDIAEVNDKISSIPEAKDCSGGGLHPGEIPAVHIRLNQCGICFSRQPLHQRFQTTFHDETSPYISESA